MNMREKTAYYFNKKAVGRVFNSSIDPDAI
jgi:hypothetical protein